MTSNSRHVPLLLIFGLFFAACTPYTLVGGQYAPASENFTVDLPEGWRLHDRYADHDPAAWTVVMALDKRRSLKWDVIRITRDGLLLQQIAIGRIPYNAEWPHTKKKLSPSMLPLEAAELVTDNLRSNPEITHQEILANTPALVAGFPGFRLHYAYRTKEELKINALFYGALADGWLYYLLYEAPAQHYFVKDLQLFENTYKSFQFSTESAS
jgi:hypothetical protein